MHGPGKGGRSPVYPIFMQSGYHQAMEPAGSDISGLIAAVAGIAALGCTLFVRLRTAASTPHALKSADGPQAGLARIQFDLAEIPAIRHILGPETATVLLAALARKLTKLGALAHPPEIGSSSITVSFAVNTAASLEDQISAAKAALAEAADVAGATFSCTVHAAILDNGSYHPDAPHLNSQGEKRAESMDDSPESRLHLLRDLQVGMANGEVTLAYQPKLDLRAGTICSAEALLRWSRPDGQQINTGDLVALCEKTGTIKEVTRWTLAAAIADNERFLAAGHSLLVFVNVSGSLLADCDFADDILKMVSQTRAQIGIEITETAVIAEPDIAIGNLDRFAKAGIAIAIDDFGAGLSSLEYLQRLPASELKIDRAFIAELSSSHRNPLITRATIDLAHALDMRVTAEGVDDDLSMALLKIMGCDLAQGYLISRPLDPLKFIDFVRGFDADGDQKNRIKTAQ